ncbi:MAG TPA: class I SAM-dependent methyltransferase [Leeuwenhoekiella sp.]|nr:class I SAM-dependent methyltransferase [Leeuwenhoekiella sp.]
MYSLKQYLKFLRKATNQHGVHSPFVYDFLTKCLYDRKKHPAYAKLKTYRKSILNDQKTIKITDFGAGSRVFKDNTRMVADLGKNAGAPLKRMHLLYRITTYFQSKSILELGTSVGLATAAFGLAATGKVTSVEGCTEIAKVALEKLEPLKIPHLHLKNERFSEFFKDREEKYDLVYFDGNHSKTATLSYFERLLPTAHNDSVFIFDDIYWSRDMTTAWETIKQHPKVGITVDCFWLGFVFFRREQNKEHFKIRL